MRTLERWEKTSGTIDKRKGATKQVANKLTPLERERAIEIANSKAYSDLPPCKIVPLLADNDEYIASESTFYRILSAEKQLTHRLSSKAPTHKKSEAYTATGPCQVFSWDITYLPAQVQGLFFYLYLIMDIYSRKIVGWSVHEEQSSSQAATLIKQVCLDEKIEEQQLVLHSDNGSPKSH